MGRPDRPEPRFPGYDVLDQAPAWDSVTREVVLRRTNLSGKVPFFTDEERETARALVDRLLFLNGDRDMPLLEMIAERLQNGDTDGFRYSDMPPDGDAWRASLEGLEKDAAENHGRAFHQLSRKEQDDMIEGVRTGKGQWHDMPAARVFSLWMRYAATAFYSHPLAWSEIGFGGPAYPRGYKNIGLDRREPWEVAEATPVDPVRAEPAEGP